MFKSYGLFDIDNSMICFDKDFRVKAWHHSDLASLKPERAYCQTVVEMINSIVKCVESIALCPEWGFTFS